MLSGVPEWRTHLNSSVGSKCADINCWASSHVQNWSTRRPCSKQGQVLIPHLDFHWKFCGKLDQNCGRLLPKRTAGSPLINVVHRPRRRRGSTSEENKEVPPAVSGSTPIAERRFFEAPMSQLRFHQQNGDPFWKKGTSGFDQHVDEIQVMNQLQHTCASLRISTLW